MFGGKLKKVFRSLSPFGIPIDAVIIISCIDKYGVIYDTQVLIQEGGQDHWYTPEQYSNRLKKDQELQTMTFYMDYEEHLFPAIGLECQLYGEDKCRFIEQLERIHQHAISCGCGKE